MPAEIFTPEAIRAQAAKNPLRQYPGVRKGKARLLPYAKPQIRTELSFADDAKFFVAGNCFGRNVEKGLAKAGRTYLSSPSDLDLPGSAKEQYNRYNIFNLDVSTNEVIWAIDPKAQPADDALIQVGDEWVDMQIHWTFAHDQAQAAAYRAEYNTSYAGIADADVVVLVGSGIEQWYDREKGIYLNGMPTAKMTALYPDRFEFHRLDIDACAESFRRAIDTVLANTTVKPVILLSVSPVAQPLVYGANDAMIEQFLAKSYQRSAAEMVCAEYDCVEYLPSVEFALLSDFKYAYQETSLNHSTQGLANRVVAEMLLRYEGETPGFHAINAIGQAEALITAGEEAAAVEIVEAALEAGAPHSVDLDFQYSQALVKSGQKQKAASWLVSRLPATEGEDKERTFRLASNLVRAYGTKDEIDTMLDHAKDLTVDPETITALENAIANRAAGKQPAPRQDASGVNAVLEAHRANDHATVIAEFEKLADDPKTTKASLERVLPVFLRSLRQTDRNDDAIVYLYQYTLMQKDPDPRWVTMLVQIAASRADADTIELILALGPKLGEKTDLTALERRYGVLTRQAANG